MKVNIQLKLLQKVTPFITSVHGIFRLIYIAHAHMLGTGETDETGETSEQKHYLQLHCLTLSVAGGGSWSPKIFKMAVTKKNHLVRLHFSDCIFKWISSRGFSVILGSVPVPVPVLWPN